MGLSKLVEEQERKKVLMGRKMELSSLVVELVHRTMAKSTRTNLKLTRVEPERTFNSLLVLVRSLEQLGRSSVLLEHNLLVLGHMKVQQEHS